MPETQTDVFPARVVEVVDEYRIVLNRGAAAVRKGQRFLVYAIGKELFDPDSGESLGHLEVVRGTGVVTHVQDRLCTVSSDRKSMPRKRTVKSAMGAYNMITGRGDEIVEEQGEDLPFDEPSTGDYAKPV